VSILLKMIRKKPFEFSRTIFNARCTDPGISPGAPTSDVHLLHPSRVKNDNSAKSSMGTCVVWVWLVYYGVFKM